MLHLIRIIYYIIARLLHNVSPEVMSINFFTETNLYLRWLQSLSLLHTLHSRKNKLETFCTTLGVYSQILMVARLTVPIKYIETGSQIIL